MVKIKPKTALITIVILILVNFIIFASPFSVTKKDVAITFDYETFAERPVGGDKIIPKILQVLDKNNVKATFFISGKTILDYYDTVEAIQKDNQSIAIHAYKHEVMTILDENGQKQVFDNIEKVAKEKNITFTGFRGPQYEANDITFKFLKQYKYCYDSTLWRGYKIKPTVKEIAVLGPDDWWWYYSKNKTSQTDFAEELKRVYFKQDGPIVIVMHPHIEQIKDPDLIALDKLIRDLKANGANFIRLGDGCK